MANDWIRSSVKSGLVYGLMACLPASIVILGVTFGAEDPYVLLAYPALVALTVLITVVAHLVKKSRSLVGAAATLGVIVAIGAGAGLIWFGIQLNITETPCDPEQSRCVVVIDGAARGESTESVGSQRFSTFILSLSAIAPGLLIIGFTTRAVFRSVRNRSAQT